MKIFLVCNSIVTTYFKFIKLYMIKSRCWDLLNQNQLFGVDKIAGVDLK